MISTESRIPLLEVVLLSLIQVNGQTLVQLRDLLSQVAAAAVDDQILCSICSLINFYEIALLRLLRGYACFGSL